MSTKAQLQKTLEKLIGDADEQTQLYESSIQRLYITLGAVYLWWRDARRYEGFLEELYAKQGLVQRGNEEKFTRLVSLVWQIDWKGHEAPKLQNWSKALRGLHHEYETNKDAYLVQDASEKIRQFFNAKGGIGRVGGTVSPLPQTDDDIASGGRTATKPKKKSELDAFGEQRVRSRHIELGERFFATEPPYIRNIASKANGLHTTRKGYAVALVRKSAEGRLDILSITNNDAIVHDTIVETYKRSDAALPPILRTLAETIKTQTLPIQFEKHRQSMNDLTDVLAADGKTKLRAVKRLLLRPQSKDILLSVCRTDCSVVTVAKPKRFPSNVSEAISLRTVNHKYVEQNMLQTRDLCFYTTNTKQIERLDGDLFKASHRLQTKNTVTDRIHNLYFYPVSTQTDGSKPQADINRTALDAPTWSATVNQEWVEDLHSICVANWLREFGSQWNRDRHKQVMLMLSKSFEVSYDGTRGYYTKTENSIPKPKTHRYSGSLSLNFRSKDIFTVLNSLAQQDIEGDLELSANEHSFAVKYSTSHASYMIAIPTCTERGHLNRSAFMAFAV